MKKSHARSSLSLTRLTDRNWARRGKTETERRSLPRSQQSVGRSVSNEVGRNDHDDGGEVHDALIRDRQIQMAKEEGEAEADCEGVGRWRGLFWSVPPFKIQFTPRLPPLPFPLGITAPELCCSSQDLQRRSQHSARLICQNSVGFVKSGSGAASASASGG